MLIDFEKHKIKGTSVRSLELRELNGEDSEAAAARVVQKDMNQVHGFVLAKLYDEQCIADAITHVNGEPVHTPYLEWKKWNLRTREFVINAYNKMNSATVKEMESFLEALGLAEKDPGPAATA